MKYLFIILIAFSFIGCDGEDVSPNPTVYATCTLLSNNDDSFAYYVYCGGLTQQEIDFSTTALPDGTTLTTDPHVAYSNNVLCGVDYSEGNVFGMNNESEIKLYVDGELFETRVVTGPGTHNFIIP